MNRDKTTVIIPTLNEAEGVGPTIEELVKELGDPVIIVVDGHSVDGTPQIAARLGATVVMQSGRGKGNAVAQALPLVPPDTRWLAIIDGDYSYPATYLPTMMQLISRDPHLAMVSGNTRQKPSSFGAHVKRLLVDRYYLVDQCFTLLHHILNHVNMRDPYSGLRLLRYTCLKDFHPKAQSFDIELEINHYIKQTKQSEILEIPIALRKRLGTIKYGYFNALELIRRMVMMALEDIIARIL